MRGLFFIMFMILILVCMFSGQKVYESYSKYNITFDIYNYTENKLVWNSTVHTENIINNLLNFQLNKTKLLIRGDLLDDSY